MLGTAIILGMVVMALAAPWIAPFDPLQMQTGPRFQAPSAAHWMGTDDFGRDVLSRVIWGARVSLPVALLAVGIGHTAGGLLGLMSGYLGGRVDLLLQRLLDAMMAFPVLVLALAIVAAAGPSLLNVVLAIAIVEIPRSARVIRAATLSIREMEFIEATRALGASGWRVVLLHVLPNCLPPYLIIATAGLGQAIIVEASLSFLGLGVPPPEPSWGGMLSGAAQSFATRAPWMVIFPGLMISVAVYSFNFVGDGLRDVLDPRSHAR